MKRHETLINLQRAAATSYFPCIHSPFPEPFPYWIQNKPLTSITEEERQPLAISSPSSALLNSCPTWMWVAAAAAAKLLQSCPTLCNSIDYSLPGSPIPGILQARTLEWVAISFSNAWKWKVKVKLLSRVWLFATPQTAAYQAPPSMGFSRQEYWSGVPSPPPMWVARGLKAHSNLYEGKTSDHHLEPPIYERRKVMGTHTASILSFPWHECHLCKKCVFEISWNKTPNRYFKYG